MRRLSAYGLTVLLSAALGTAVLAQPKAAEPFALVVAPAGPKNARNSEAAIIPLKDGRLLLGWTDFYTDDGGDFGPAVISGKISADGGRTWGEKYTLVENEGKCNVIEVNFMRLKDGRIALLYDLDNGETDLRITMRTSSDEGKTFVEPKRLSPENKYTGLTNGRCIRLKSGRILLESWENNDSFCMISDDDGATWRESQRVKPAGGGSWEPAAIELKDGRVLMLMRTGLGCQYQSISADGGETWSQPEPTALRGTAAPVAITRIPTTGNLLAIWNEDIGSPRGRNPLTSAISRNEGKTWGHFRNIEDAPDDSWAYPAVTWVGDTALVTYFNYTGGLSLHLRGLPARWFYE